MRITIIGIVVALVLIGGTVLAINANNTNNDETNDNNTSQIAQEDNTNNNTSGTFPVGSDQDDTPNGSDDSNNELPPSEPDTNPDTPTTSPEEVTFTLAEVQVHNTKEDCWTIVNGEVFDITTYIPRHPGGSIILNACGTDGTDLFMTKGGTGSDHSETAKRLRDGFFIGTLAN